MKPFTRPFVLIPIPILILILSLILKLMLMNIEYQSVIKQASKTLATLGQH
jgi:hypothetical protein